MTDDRKALYLLADSQLLFWNVEGNRFISSIRENLHIDQATITKAAYIGASNGDNPEFFSLFVAAMDNIDIHESRMIHSAFSQEDQDFIESADLILLAGGDFKLGWEVLKKTGMDKIIAKKYLSGAVIIGISAGAMQLGLGGIHTSSTSTDKTFIETMRLVPYYIGAHDEKNSWSDLKYIIKEKEQYSKGFGISAGGGMIYHPDSVIEPLRGQLSEFKQSTHSDGRVLANILLPPKSAEV